MTSIRDAFISAMYRAGLETNDPIVADGRLRRFHVMGDRKGTQNGWFILYPDYPTIGVFGCWKRYIIGKWQQNIDGNMIVSDRRKAHERCQSMQKQLDLAFKSEHEALTASTAIWHNALPASDRHGYLVSKGVRSHGLRYHMGALLVPVTDIDGYIHGMQRIWPNGDKRFHKGTVTTGRFYMIGVPSETTLLICEGYSTGATLHETTGHAVIVAFGSGNLRPVSEVARAAWPNFRIIICADDDFTVPGNPGLTAAFEAAATINAELVVPLFPLTREKTDSDFNDLFRIAGASTILDCLSGRGGNYANV